jgi:hypothetical protein
VRTKDEILKAAAPLSVMQPQLLLEVLLDLRDRVAHHTERPPDVCTGSLTVATDGPSSCTAIPTHGRCGICGLSWPVNYMPGAPILTTHPWSPVRPSEHLQRLALKPGEVLVVRHDPSEPQAELHRVAADLAKHFPDRVVFVPQAFDLAVIEASPAGAPS